jgi:hypothetical protein
MEIFRTRPERPWGPHSIQYNGYRVSLPGVKQPGRDVDHSLQFSVKVKKRGITISLLPFWAFMAFPRMNFTFIYIYLFIFIYLNQHDLISQKA